MNAMREPIAIIGIGCRFPGGVRDPESYWALLTEGRDAITEIPAGRWRVADYFDASGSAPGKCAARWGGFLEDVDGFDAEFFHVGPKEAAHMDPQHRLLLEVAWEAIERAGIPAEHLAGSSAGVFTGIYTDDYRLLHVPHAHRIDAYSGTGTIHTMAANRISYCFDLKGPSMAVDATCASSLVAIHLACESLAREECDLAIAGAVNLILSPLSMLAAAKVVAMSADGRCKTFDARADGIVRSEGCGVVVLKRLNDALADGDEVWAVIEGTAVNQDGRSNGITAPNPAAQEDVIRRALKRAGLEPDAIQYVEAHGTGTALGDPIEMEALARVFPPGLRIGSVKTNLGHLEAAAGMAGLIKAALAVRHARIPAHLHLKRLNPAVAEFAHGFEIPTHLSNWPGNGQCRRAGVSAFSLGGTNAHAIIAAAPTMRESTPIAGPHETLLFAVSAESTSVLSRRTQDYADWLSGAGRGIDLSAAAYTAAIRRTHHRCRLAVAASSSGDAAAKLRRRLETLEARKPARPLGGLAFVFTGQGARWSLTGSELVRCNSTFRESLERSDKILQSCAQWSLLRDLEKCGGSRPMRVSQAAIFSLQLALVDLLETLGVRPAAVIGHSLGEAAAACAAGALSREDAITMLVQRGELCQRMNGCGKMAAIGLPPANAQAIVDRYDGQISVAAINSDCSVVLSGDTDGIDRVREEAQREGFTFVPLPTDYAFHSSQVMPLVPALVQAARRIRHRAPTGVIYSTVTGRRIQGEDFGPVHWGRNLAEPVRFAEAVSAAIRDGYREYLEIGPSAALSPHIRRLLDENRVEGFATSLLNNGTPEWESVLRLAGDHYERGHDIRWHSLYPTARPSVPMPLYPWNRQRYWLEAEDTEAERHKELQPAAWAWHDVAGERVLSAAGFLDAVLTALGEPSRDGVVFERVEIHDRFAPAEPHAALLRTSLTRQAGDAFEFTIRGPQSRRLATGVARLQPGEAGGPATGLLGSIQVLPIPRHESAHAAAMLDICLRTAASSFVEQNAPAYVTGIDLVVVRGGDQRPKTLRFVRRDESRQGSIIDIDALDEENRPAMQVRGLCVCRPIEPSQLSQWTYDLDWQPCEMPLLTASSDSLSIYEKAAPLSEALCVELAKQVLRSKPARIPDRYNALGTKLIELGGRATGVGCCAGAIRTRLEHEFPALSPEIDLLVRCAEALPAVLDGRADAVEVIFAPGTCGPSPADRVYRESPFALYWNEIVRRTVLEAIDSMGAGSSKVRIIEVGAGTGGTTAALLPHLENRNVEYWFTDVSGWFLSRARTEFGNYPFVKYGRLDFTRDCVSQHFTGKEFDIVLAANCIHAAEGTCDTLRKLRELVRPGGSLILLEGTSNRDWADLTFGATEGWFHNEEQQVPIDPDEWVKVLATAGWQAARSVRHGSTAVIQARLQSADKQCWILLGNPLSAAGKIADALHASGEEIRFAGAASDVAVLESERAGVVDCRYADYAPECSHAVEMAVELARSLAARNWKTPPRLWFVTCGAHAPETPGQIVSSAVNGVARVLFTEHPEFAGGAIDLENLENLESSAQRVERIVRHQRGEDCWRIRGGDVFVARTKRRSFTSRSVRLREQGTYLLTGGTGGMGLYQADWLVKHGARHIVLMGRRERPELSCRLAAIAAGGAEVSFRRGDVGDRGQIARVIREIEESGFPLRGVIHCAGVAHDAVIGNLTAEDIRRVLRPKVTGGWNLHVLTQEMPLDFFLLCSSAATLIGLTGLCAYTAANAFLDGLAAYRRAIGLPAHAIDWGGWCGTGMAERVGEAREHQWIARGLYTMEPERAVEALSLAIDSAGARSCVMSVDWEEFRNGFPNSRIPALYEFLLPRPAAEAPQRASAANGGTILIDRLQLAPVSERPDLFFSFLRELLSKLLAQNLPGYLDPTQSLWELGLDSLMAVEMRNSLAGALGIVLPVTTMFDYPSPETLLCYAAQLAGLELPKTLKPLAAGV
jgi:acyl transferase domain-containing protein/NAD(P)-dependent dehydrogenase (short-subunit alcohol dehydrogenase family)/SAM-dependent methyltransferase